MDRTGPKGGYTVLTGDDTVHFSCSRSVPRHPPDSPVTPLGDADVCLVPDERCFLWGWRRLGADRGTERRGDHSPLTAHGQDAETVAGWRWQREEVGRDVPAARRALRIAWPGSGAGSGERPPHLLFALTDQQHILSLIRHGSFSVSWKDGEILERGPPCCTRKKHM